MLKEMVHKFADQRAAGMLEECEEKYPFYSKEVLAEYRGLGLLGINMSEKYGGGGLTSFEAILAIEELARVSPIAALPVFETTVGPIRVVEQFGTEEQKKKFLPPLTKEMTFACFGLTEREAGSDNSAIKTTAKKDGDYYIINGSKTFITNAGVSKLGVIFVSTDKDRGARGQSAFIVPMDLPGITVGKHENKMGHRASNTAEIFFDDVKVPAENILKREGFGFIIAMKTLDYARPAVGAGGIGVARAAYEEALKYSQNRVQFGKPIASFQYNSFKLADMATEIDAARLLVYRSAWMLDNKLKASKESAMAKIVATDTAMKVTVDAVQLFGGYGYMKEYPVEKMMRDAKLLQIYEGTNEIQRYVIALEILGTLKK